MTFQEYMIEIYKGLDRDEVESRWHQLTGDGMMDAVNELEVTCAVQHIALKDMYDRINGLEGNADG